MKKLVSLLLSTLLLFSLAACGQKDPDSKTPDSKTAEGKLLPTAAGELPIVPEGTDITLTVAVMQTPLIADYATNYFTKWIEEKSGVKLEFVVLPADTIEEKVLLTLSTNDAQNLPDIYLSTTMKSNNTIFGPSYAPMWHDQGMIIPLNGLIDEYGFYLQEALKVAEDDGYNVKEWITSADGNIYAFPSFSASLTNSYPQKLWINQGWLDALNLPVPQTTEELRETLRAFKTKDPNGNGQADEIPYAGAKYNTMYGYDFIINAFVYNHVGYSRMMVENGKVVFAPTTKEWRDAMIFLRELHDEGLYYEGSFTQDQTALQQMGMNENDILGGFEALGHDLVLVTKDQNIIDRYAAVPALKGPEGKHYTSYSPPSVRPSGIITSKCEYPEIALRVLDLMCSDEAAKITRYGEKGVNWDDADPGTTGYYGTPAIMKILDNTWAVAGQNQNFLQQSPFVLDPAVATGIQWDGNPKEAGYIKAAAVMQLQKTGEVPDEVLANLVFTAEEVEKITTPKTDIDSYILQSIANFVAGEWNPKDDAQWDAYVAEYEKMGLPVFLETVQTTYDRMKANSK